MSAFNQYQSPELLFWQGRKDAPKHTYFYQNIQLLDLNNSLSTAKESATGENFSFALLGFCCDAGIKRNQGRIGAAKAPDAIRQSLAKLALHRQNINLYDAGNIICINDDLEAAQKELAQAVAILLQHHCTPIILGGGHEVAFGHYQGLTQQQIHADFAILNFDAHFDMRALIENSLGSSGTPFLQIALAQQKKKQPFNYYCAGIQPANNSRELFNTAKQYGVHLLKADDMHHPQKSQTFIQQILTHQEVYVSLCLDVIASAYAPGVSAPQALGLEPWLIVQFLREIAQSGKVCSYDIAELCPALDVDERTAKLAAQFIYEIIDQHVFRK